MAACTFAVATPDTGNTPNTSGAFTPASGDLLVVCAAVTNSTDTPADSQLSSSIGGFGFTFINSAVRGTSDTVYVYVSNALVSDTSSQTVTWTHASDAGNGSAITVYRVSGMSKTGVDAVRQSVGDNGGSGVTPGATFSSSCLTGNPTITFLLNQSNPAGVTAPTDWTENASADIGYNTPTTGASSAHRDSGFTGTDIDWGSSATGWAVVQLELDASAAAHEGSGTPSLPLITASGSGRRALKSTGTPNLPLLTASGTGKRGLKSTGTPSLPILTASGTGKRGLKSTGTPSLPLLTASGTGKRTLKATGTPSLPLLTADGAGEVQAAEPVHPGSGVVTLPILTAEGTGKRGLKSTGTPSLPILTASGVGKRTLKGSGTVVLPILVADGGAVLTSLVPQETEQTPAGRKRPRRYLVEIDGREFVVSSLDEALSLLDKAQALAIAEAERQTEKQVKTSLPKALKLGKVAQVQAKTPDIKVSPELQKQLDEKVKQIKRIYRDAAINAELRILMALEAERDDEDVLLLM